MSANALLALAVAVLPTGLAGGLAFAAGRDDPAVTVVTVHGYAGPRVLGDDGANTEWPYGRDSSGIAYTLTNDVPWRDAHGGWHYGTWPPCIHPGNFGPVRLGVVNVPPDGGGIDAPGDPVVIWATCPR